MQNFGNHALGPGDLFGEISLAFECKRTATVTSTKFATIAKMTPEKFHETTLEFPNLQKLLKKKICSYNDPDKKLLLC